jgi:predicted ATPase/DNA-binding CsgD family transcriptional regulator
MSFPNQLTTFIGREREIAEVLAAARRSRLVTLTGPGGIGKTRLAVEAARRLQEQDEIVSLYFVDLASVPDADGLEAAVVVAVGGHGGDRTTSLESIVDVLADPRSLLVIDNCEHLVIPVAHTVERLLRGTRSLSVFATSREALDIAGEARYQVPPLNDDDGVRLFIERAQLFTPEPRAMDASKAAILQLCHGLDGLPLAIELAAARVSHLPVAEIVSRLDDRFRLLTRSSRNAAPRHQSLQAAIAWSFDLLDEIERTAFISLSVFTGGFDEAAAEGVAGCSLDGLGRLVDKSMVIAYAGKDGRARYRLLETMRQFALARLQDSGRAEEVERRHFSHFAGLARQVAGEIHGPRQAVWIERLDEELNNVRLALKWGSDHDPDGALAMAVDLIWFWHHRGHNHEGRSWLKRLSAAASSSPPALVAAALTQAADFAFLSGDRATAVAELDHALILWRRLGDPAGISRTLVARAVSDGPSLASLVGQRQALEEAVAEARRAGQSHLLVEALTFLGHAEGNAGNVERCMSHLHEAEATARRSGDVWRQALVLHELGCVDEERGKLDSAAAAYEESLKLQQMAKSSLITGGTHVRLGFVRLDQNREEDARKHFEGALTAEGLALPEAGAVRGLSLLAGRRGSYERALKLHGAYSSMPFFGWRSEATQLENQPWIASARRAVGADAADAIWGAGARMSASEALDYALSDADEPTADDGPLTARELEIAALVGRGRRNREIATQLYLSPRTVEAHLEHIRNKLGYQSRSEVAAWANERGLLKGERV